MKRKQRTLAHEVSCEGVGLFDGLPVRLILKPAPEDTGVVFVRTDLEGSPRVQACIGNVAHDLRRTSLASGEARVTTVEHLLAALSGLHVDNVLILIDAAEAPVMDGSALTFVRLLQSAGFKEQNASRAALSVTRPVRVDAGDAHVEVTPGTGEGLRVSYELCYPGGRLGPQTASFEVTPEVFATEIAPARSYVLEEEIEGLRSLGLGKGANEENTVVLRRDGAHDKPARFSDELTRHKILDLIGDLSLLGADVVGSVKASRSGHSLNHAVTKELKAQMEKTSGKPFEALLDIEQIREILPHRYPFLLVDRVLELEPGKRVLGYKNVTVNEHFFSGHFPGKALMPGVLQLEAMAQIAGVLMLQKIKDDNRLAVLLSMDGVKFRRGVVPGDRLMLEAIAVRLKTRTGQVKCTASVEGQLAAEATINFMLIDMKESTSDNTKE